MNVEFGMRNTETELAERLLLIFPHSAFQLPHSNVPGTIFNDQSVYTRPNLRSRFW
jgi:hypothetical protein